MGLRHISTVLLPLLFLVGCTEQVGLNYAPSGTTASTGGPATISQVAVTDQRNEADPTWIGAIRGGFGNPLKVLHLSHPLRDEVAAAFRDALKARGMLDPSGNGPYELSAVVTTFASHRWCGGKPRRPSKWTSSTEDAGATLYHDVAKVDLVSGSVLALDTGIFADTSDLQALAQRSLVQCIDQLLDKPGFRAAVGSPSKNQSRSAELPSIASRPAAVASAHLSVAATMHRAGLHGPFARGALFRGGRLLFPRP